MFRLQRKLLLGSLTLATLVLQPASLSFSDERVTDMVILEMFGKAHSVMKDQRERLHTILDSFLMGDLTLVESNATEVAAAMEEAAVMFPTESVTETQQWKLMAAVVEQSRLLKKAAQEKDYPQAYRNFSNLMGSCIACHQIRRPWGKFPEPLPQTPPQQSK